MRENEPVLLVLSVCDGEIILEKGEILCEKCQVFPIVPSCFGRSNCAFLHFASNLARVEAARFARAVMRGRCTLVEKQSMKTKEIM